MVHTSTANRVSRSVQDRSLRLPGTRWHWVLGLLFVIGLGGVTGPESTSIAAEFTTPKASSGGRSVWTDLQTWWDNWLQPRASQRSSVVPTCPNPLYFHRSPLYQLTLVSGESLLAEWIEGDGQRISIRRGAKYRARLPREVVQSIALLPGTELVWYHAGRVVKTTERPRWAGSVASGQFQAWPFSVSDQYEAPPVATCRLLFSADELSLPQPLELVVTATHHVDLVLPLGWSCTTRQRWRPPPGVAAPLAVQWSAERWTVLRGDVILASGSKPDVSLISVEFPAAEDAVAWEDALLSRRRTEVAAEFPSDARQDAVELIDGSFLYGRWQGATATGITLNRGGTRHEISRRDVRKLSLRTSVDWPSHTATLVRGPIATVLQPSVGGLTQWPEQRFVGGMRQTDLEHPWLGPRFPMADDASIRVLSRGTWRWLYPGTFHLGDEIRDDLQPHVPEGTYKSGQWTMMTVPEQPTFLSVEVVDLEPSGVDTPDSQPFLSSLRRGELISELWINGHSLGPLNDRLTWRARPDDPARIRIRIPREFLLVGRNSWEIRQHPDSESRGYDDAQFGRIALESTVDRTE